MATVRQRPDRWASILRALVAGALLAGAGTLAVPSPAAAQGACQSPLQPGAPIEEEPWEERLFGLSRLSPVPDGRGVRIAVIDTGVDTRHPQLDDGQVAAGTDFVPEGGPDGRVDCDGHGTAVASIIAASDVEGVQFAGLAQGATILPARVTERESDIPHAAVADAIVWATEQDADIINLSLYFMTPSTDLASAVEFALDNDVIVVAAVSQGDDIAEAGPDPGSFPAQYEGVVGVGAITSEGIRDPSTYAGSDVDLLAPGSPVTVAWAGGDRQLLAGTSFATAFVSAAAALVLAANPDLTGPEVVDLLKATADPGPGSTSEPNNAGVVSPYRALTGRISNEEPVAIPPPVDPPVDPVAQARAERWEQAVQRALLIVLIAVSVTALGFTAAAVWRRGQRHRWLPGQRRDPVFPHPISDEPERLFYTVPTPRSRD